MFKEFTRCVFLDNLMYCIEVMCRENWLVCII